MGDFTGKRPLFSGFYRRKSSNQDKGLLLRIVERKFHSTKSLLLGSLLRGGGPSKILTILASLVSQICCIEMLKSLEKRSLKMPLPDYSWV